LVLSIGQHEFVFVPDVDPAVVKMLETLAAFGQAWNLGSAGVITQREMAQLAFGGPPKVIAAGKTMLRLMGCSTRSCTSLWRCTKRPLRSTYNNST
jgi:nucleoside-diphosphate-sugar epimerase